MRRSEDICVGELCFSECISLERITHFCNECIVIPKFSTIVSALIIISENEHSNKREDSISLLDVLHRINLQLLNLQLDIIVSVKSQSSKMTSKYSESLIEVL